MLNNIIMADAKGSANSIPFELYEYTHDEDWLTDEKGNGKYFLDTYCINGDGIYYITVENNPYKATYAGISAYSVRGLIGSITHNAVHRKGYADNGNVVNNTSFRIGAGSLIRVFFFSKENIVNAR